jgi:hypothetical protein
MRALLPKGSRGSDPGLRFEVSIWYALGTILFLAHALLTQGNLLLDGAIAALLIGPVVAMRVRPPGEWVAWSRVTLQQQLRRYRSCMRERGRSGQPPTTGDSHSSQVESKETRA